MTTLFEPFPEGSPALIRVPLEETTTTEGDTVTLTCELSKPAPESAWFKDDLEVLPDDHYKVTTEGKALGLTIHEVGPEDEAEYTVEIGELSSTALLHVKGAARYQNHSYLLFFAFLFFFIIYHQSCIFLLVLH